VIQYQKQPMMMKVVYSLIPIFLYSIFLYGWRSVVLTALSVLIAVTIEWVMEKGKKKKTTKVSQAAFVTALLFALSLPPRTPLWIAAIGIFFGIFFGKMAFGGFGRNIFNPAITGRLFIYITFPTIMTNGSWMSFGNFGLGADAVSAATPLALMRAGEGTPNILNLLFGLRTGSLGEGPIFLIIAAGLYLIFTNTASWRIIVSMLLSGLGLHAALYYAGVPGAPTPLLAVMSGSFLFVTVFMATDPVSGPKKQSSQWIYGILIGVVTVLVRTFSLFPEGTSFGVLMGNTFASLIDEVMPKPKKKAKKGAAK